jgi:O-methyltransferase
MNAALEYAEKIAYSSKETLYFTYEQAVKFKDTPGVFCECGCAAGAQVIALAAGAPNKTIYAFDSWEGIPLPSNRDDQMPGIRMLKDLEQKALPDPGKQVLESSGATVVSIEDFMSHITKSGISMPDRIFPMKGWFEKTVPYFANIEKYINGSIFEHSMDISILRLDGDLYNSTWVCLQHLFPKVIKGGLVIIDDWTLPGCRAACEEYFNLIDYTPEYQFLSTISYFYK